MSTPDRRLDDLQRQRALVQQHLAWLDREIAAAQSSAPTGPASVTPAAVPVAPRSSYPAAGAVPDTDAEAILDQYRSAGPTLKTQVRNGCLLYAGLALALLLLGAVALSYFLRR